MAGYKGGFGGFGGNAQMQQLMKQAQKMQEEMTKAQQELDEAEIEGESGGGLVKVVVNGETIEVHKKPAWYDIVLSSLIFILIMVIFHLYPPKSYTYSL